MTDIFNRFSLDAIKWTDDVKAVVLILWLLVVLCGISSIISQPISRKNKVMWTLFILFVPLIGVLVYLPFSIRLENYPQLFAWRKKTY
jgi:hypothetical protein